VGLCGDDEVGVLALDLMQSEPWDAWLETGQHEEGEVVLGE
jgi:hypothetical protein